MTASKTPPKPPSTMETERLEFERVSADLWDEIHSLFSTVQDVERVFRYCGWSPHEESSDTASYISDRTQEWDNRKRYEYVVYEKNGAAIGTTYLAPDRMFGQPELGLWLRKEAWGNRYAGEVVDRLLELGFEELGSDCIRAGCSVENTTSQTALARVFGNNGGVFEGTIQRPTRQWHSFSLRREQYENSENRELSSASVSFL